MLQLISFQIQIILQNRAGGYRASCDEHPWHFHGRFFHVVASGADEYDPVRDLPIIDETVQNSDGLQFQFRDVFVMFPHQSVTNNTAGNVLIIILHHLKHKMHCVFLLQELLVGGMR